MFVASSMFENAHNFQDNLSQWNVLVFEQQFSGTFAEPQFFADMFDNSSQCTCPPGVPTEADCHVDQNCSFVDVTNCDNLAPADDGEDDAEDGAASSESDDNLRTYGIIAGAVVGVAGIGLAVRRAFGRKGSSSQSSEIGVFRMPVGW